MADRNRWSRRSVVASALAMPLLQSPPAVAQTPPATPAASSAGATDRGAWLTDAAGLLEQGVDPDLRIIALTPAETFAMGRLPGAVGIDWPALELATTTEAAISEWAGAMRALTASLGIGPESRAVVYDEGSLFAARLCWVLTYLGHDATRILDGGLPAWQAAGMPLAERDAATPVPVMPLPAATVEATVLASLSEVGASLGAGDTVLVDARTPEEYAAGHIPGAVNVNYPLNAEPEALRFWKPTADLIELYAAVGVTPGKRVIPYCSTGVRSAVTWFTLRMIGFPDVALFTGSWAEWSAHPELPVTTGDRP